ncbi:hypothetical protein LHYA1_G004910 [Lachnellula hyalina]|uniref:Uncharacterized protein n=1 Tax=Lachnellula hyalina TaxID=1316788 RepID=A0A8H8R362_9HELO|nr:uncharacterized protein LHYA1_G004910 [Lachnellula hyalina]TVY27677.1 hypothetical protein LHYA1_G004910 [Lachnellula hyalina]
MPLLPAARTFTTANGIIGGVAVTASATPLLFFLPGAGERIAVQSAKWGPRWENNLSYIAPKMEKGAARIEPRIQKGVKVVEPPMKRAAFAIDRNIKSLLNASK